MKTCKGNCGKEKESLEFYGKSSKCKVCYKEMQSKRTKANPEKTRAIRMKSHRKLMRESDSYREKRDFMSNSDRIKNPEKRIAQAEVQRLIRRGGMDRPDCCSSCKTKGKTHAHHSDYNKKLDVIFLCASCHHLWHRDHFYNKETFTYSKKEKE